MPDLIGIFQNRAVGGKICRIGDVFQLFFGKTLALRVIGVGAQDRLIIFFDIAENEIMVGLVPTRADKQRIVQFAENARAAVVVAEPVEEREVCFVMDRFGYGKVMEKNIYERNQETVHQEYRTIVPCMNTDKLCVFTHDGWMHQIKVQDIPAGRLRDKGVPLDNLCNYDSRQEEILLIIPDRAIKENNLLFVTASSLSKLVEGKEFIVQKKKVAATKLGEGDRLIAIVPVDGQKKDSSYLVMQSEQGYFLRFPLGEISQKKKNALGIRGMSLKEDDCVKQIYLTDASAGEHIIYKEKELYFQKIKLMSRDTRGVKVRR